MLLKRKHDFYNAEACKSAYYYPTEHTQVVVVSIYFFPNVSFVWWKSFNARARLLLSMYYKTYKTVSRMRQTKQKHEKNSIVKKERLCGIWCREMVYSRLFVCV